MEGEDGRPAGGPCAMEGHMQDPVRRLNAVLLQRDVFGVKGKLSFQDPDLREHPLECPLRSAAFTCMKVNSEGRSSSRSKSKYTAELLPFKFYLSLVQEYPGSQFSILLRMGAERSKRGQGERGIVWEPQVFIQVIQ